MIAYHGISFVPNEIFNYYYFRLEWMVFFGPDQYLSSWMKIDVSFRTKRIPRKEIFCLTMIQNLPYLSIIKIMKQYISSFISKLCNIKKITVCREGSSPCPTKTIAPFVEWEQKFSFRGSSDIVTAEQC